MASGSSFREEDLSCPVCRDIFKNPVLVPCGHSFCETCLRETWKQRECPVCRRKCSKDWYPPNLSLESLCEAFSQSHTGSQKSTSKISSALCGLHGETLDLEDKQPVCLVWQDTRQRNHKPLAEAVQDHKNQAQNTERQIKEEFQKLHRFLREEEEASIATLREEEEQKSQTMKEKIEEMNRQNYKATVKRSCDSGPKHRLPIFCPV
ncbi:E3 ubiquitin-protein ligase TRIM39 isoform X2 [Oncorhynchus kisutch]|uniref:E3 ubiquitin-protein ligase TRIM39 isoform X2 n=1 Tax=Oncorhynchus kisutch TaxID=8019 RepID=UPI0012DCE6D5|nr:E3 ubiquitin-protein ligase TRIM39 isoform X2 [Oncorhynchus kisutch]